MRFKAGDQVIWLPGGRSIGYDGGVRGTVVKTTAKRISIQVRRGSVSEVKSVSAANLIRDMRR